MHRSPRLRTFTGNRLELLADRLCSELGREPLAWLAVVTSVIMMLLWNVLLHDLTSVEVAVCTNAQPPATALLTALLAGVGWLDRQQDLGLLFFSGMLLVIFGVMIVQFRRA